MEIKLGQYVRDEVYFGRITKVNEYDGMFKTSRYIDIEEQYLLDHKHNLRKERCNIKIANTPQELIEVRDLLFLNRNEPYIVEKDSYGTYIIMNNKLQYIETLLLDITKILTPNSNGSVYTQQWSILDDSQR